LKKRGGVCAFRGKKKKFGWVFLLGRKKKRVIWLIFSGPEFAKKEKEGTLP